MPVAGQKPLGIHCSMIKLLDRLHARARKVPALHRLAIISRILLFLAFLPTGLVKALGRRFTLLGVEHPAGAFFEAMYQTGFYWHFIGIGQIVAALLLLVPMTRTLGAVMFLPIVANITVVTWSVDFAGTLYVTTLMLLANLFLLAWDWHRLRSIVASPADGAADMAPLDSPVPLPRIERMGYGIGTGAGLVVFLATRGFGSEALVMAALPVGAIAVLLILAGWLVAARRIPAGELPDPERIGSRGLLS